MDDKRLVSLKTAAQSLNVPIELVRRWIRTGLPVVRVGWVYRVRVRDLEKFLRDHTRHDGI